MRTIILPGYSPSNKEWALEVSEKVGGNAIVHEWRHWTSGSLSVKYEVAKLSEVIGNEKVNIIAKSVGTRIAMHLLATHATQINKLILCGLPIRWEKKIADTSYKELVDLRPSQVLVFQNTKDPLGNYVVIRKFIDQINPKITVVEGDRSDHNYPYSERFRKFLE